MAAKIEVILGLKDDLTKGLSRSQVEMRRFSATMKRSLSSMNAFIAIPAVLAAGAMARMGKSFTDAAMDVEAMNSRIKAAVLNGEQFKESMTFLPQLAQNAGVNFKNLSESFGGFAAAALRSNMTFDQTKQIFRDIAETSVSMRLSQERTKLVFEALQQMASKGVVSMEELRRQLADSLPGAVQIGARAMNMTTQAFMKAVSAGEIMANDFLPKFGAQVRKELGGSFKEASNSLQANVARMQNSFFMFKARIAAEFMPALKDATKEIVGILDGMDRYFGLIRGGIAITVATWKTLWNTVTITFTAVRVGVEQLFGWTLTNVRAVYDWVKLLIDAFARMGRAVIAIKDRKFNILENIKAEFDGFGGEIAEVEARYQQGMQKLAVLGSEAVDKGVTDIKDIVAAWKGAVAQMQGKNNPMLDFGGGQPPAPDDPDASKEKKKKEFDWYPAWMKQIADRVISQQNRMAENARRTAEMTRQAYANMAFSISNSVATIISSTVKEAKKRQSILAAITMGEGIAASILAFHEAWKSKGTGDFYSKLAISISTAAATVASTVAAVANIKSQSFARGTSFAPGGMSRVGEEGPEYMQVPRGARIYSAAQSRTVNNNIGGSTLNLTINGNADESVMRDAGMRLIRQIEDLSRRRYGPRLAFAGA